MGGDVARVREEKCVQNFGRRDHSEDPDVDGWIILEMI
jgi:hypothetical protein